MIKKALKTLMVFALVGTVGVTTVNASSISDLKEKNEETKKKKEQAEGILNQLSTEKDDILSVIYDLDNKINEYNNEIDELEAKKEQLNLDIQQKKIELDEAKERENAQYEAMKRRIQYAYENGNVGLFDSIFASTDISEMVNKSEYVEQIYNYDSFMLSQLIRIKEVIEETEASLEADLDEVETIEENVIEDKESVQIMMDGKQVQLDNYTKSIDQYQEQVNQYIADMEATNAQIAAAEAAAREAAAAAAAAQGIAPEDVVINYTGGAFQWPVSTGGTITSTFGARWGTIHQGLDIACPEGTPIVAGESGTVIISQYSGSAGNYVMIDHGGGVCTVYMHNSQLCVSVGQTVSRGDVIALSGNTGFSTGPHCHFGVRINGSYVDPLPYL